MNPFYQLTNKSFESEGVASHKELWEKVKSNHRGFCLTVNTEFQKTYEDDTVTNMFHVVMSTAIEDRHGEIVFQNWDLTNFKKNPVFLDSHNYGSIEHILGKMHNTEVLNNQLEGDVEFALENPKGMLAFKLALGGFLNANSVGFIPKGFDDKGNITSAELLENSAVSVPANAHALFEKSFDMETEIAFVKDGRVLSKTNLQKLKSAVDAISAVIASAENEDKEDKKPEEKKIVAKSKTPDIYTVLMKKIKERDRIIKEVSIELHNTKPHTLADRKGFIYNKLRDALKV
jgi:hypothetical protein